MAGIHVSFPTAMFFDEAPDCLPSSDEIWSVDLSIKRTLFSLCGQTNDENTVVGESAMAVTVAL